MFVASQVNVPKLRRTFCKDKKCRKHRVHKVTQYKTGKASKFAQGARRYKHKQQGYGGQTKPVFHKKVGLFPHVGRQSPWLLYRGLCVVLRCSVFSGVFFGGGCATS